MRRQIEGLRRYIVTPETSEHRLFMWLRYPVLPDKNLIVFPRDDDAFFGLLHSRFHEAWSAALGNRMGQGNQRRYNNTSVFDTFPFPTGMTPNLPAPVYAESPAAIAIAAVAAKLVNLREAWLNPPEWVREEPEVVDGFPNRLVPVNAQAAQELRSRTLTELYNKRPTWLRNVHAELDAAVAAAYGWPDDIGEDEALSALLALNHRRGSVRGCGGNSLTGSV